jgi:hypothetical protein
LAEDRRERDRERNLGGGRNLGGERYIQHERRRKGRGRDREELGGERKEKESVFSGSSLVWIGWKALLMDEHDMHACRAYRVCSTGKDDHPQYIPV